MHLAMRYSSEIGGAPAGDMFVIGNAKSSWHKVGEQISAMLIFTNKTFSETGEVKLTRRIGMTSPPSTSISCPTNAIWTG